MTRFKIAAAVVAALTLVSVFAAGRSPAPPAPPAAPPFTTVWNDAASSVILKNADASQRMAVEAPRVIPLLQIEPTPTKAPPELIVPPEPPSKKEKHAESNICTKHAMQKVWVNKYKWRCRKL